MATEPSVHVLIVNWNGRRHLESCLPSLLASRYRRFEVVLLDNGSTDDSVEWVQRNFGSVHVEPLHSNLGFAAANNAGLRRALAARADYATLLNNDTRVDEDWLGALVEVAERDPQVAVCQARQRTWDGSQEIRFRFIPAWAEAETEYCPVEAAGAATPTPFASGCAMLLRCRALPQIGLFDERYFMYVEDVDLTLRAWIAGYRAMDVPASIVYHRMTGSTSGQRQRMVWGYRNQLTTMLKTYQQETLCSFAGPINRRWLLTRNRYALRGTLGTLSMLPGTLAQRWSVQRRRRAPDQVFLELCSQ